MKLTITESENGFTAEFTDKSDDWLLKLHNFFGLLEKVAEKKGIPDDLEIKRCRKVEILDAKDIAGFMKIMGIPENKIENFK